MNKQEVSKEEEKEDINLSTMFPNGLVNFLKGMQGQQQRQLPNRKRSGLGGPGYTRSVHNEARSRMRRKLAKNGQPKKIKKSRRKAKKKRQRAK